MNAVTEAESLALNVSTPGLYFDLDIDAYHGGDGISKTGLDSIDANPAIYYGRHLDPKRPPPKDRAGQLEGSLTHCAVLEPNEFGKRYMTLPKDAPRRPTDAQWNAKNPSDDSKAAMAWWREWNAKTNGATVISADQYDTAWRQAESIRKLPEVAEALLRGRAEVSAYWTDPLTGELCRCRPDWAHDCGTSQTILLDVKTCSDASPSEFRRQIARKRYHVQDSFYSDGYAAASGREVVGFVFVAVESEWPYAACALMLDDQGKAQGRTDYRRNLNTYAACRKSGVWPGYSSQIEVVNLPAWAITGENL
jgi:exodeoxyribonuclease VIII